MDREVMNKKRDEIALRYYKKSFSECCPRLRRAIDAVILSLELCEQKEAEHEAI